MSIKRISLIGVPVDVIQPENLENEILELLAKPGTKQIVFLSIWNLLKARHKGTFSECIKNADLIIPVSKSILRAAKFLRLPVPARYNPFYAMIKSRTPERAEKIKFNKIFLYYHKAAALTFCEAEPPPLIIDKFCTVTLLF